MNLSLLEIFLLSLFSLCVAVICIFVIILIIYAIIEDYRWNQQDPVFKEKYLWKHGYDIPREIKLAAIRQRRENN